MLRFAENQFCGESGAAHKIESKTAYTISHFHTAFSDEGQKRHKDIPVETPTVEEGGTAEVSEAASLSLEKETN